VYWSDILWFDYVDAIQQTLKRSLLFFKKTNCVIKHATGVTEN
jgi:hypothetical protein